MTDRRLVGVDVARCLALLGMMATHVVGKRTVDGDLTWAYAIAGGRASALFAVLAGVSLALATGGHDPARERPGHRMRGALALRAGLIALLGLALGDLDSGIAIILAHYGVLFLLALGFLTLGLRALLLLAAAWVLVAPVLLHLLLPRLPAYDGRSPVLGDLAAPDRLVAELMVTGTYPVLAWLSFVLIGLALGRMDLRRTSRGVALLVGGGAAAVTAYAVSRAFTAQQGVRDALGFEGATHAELRDRLADGTGGAPPADGGWAWLLVVAPHSATSLDLIHTAGTAAAVLGACLLLTAGLRGGARRAVAIGFGAGTMPLTLYAVHVVLHTPTFWPPEQPSSYGWHVLVVLGIGALTVGMGARGPLEAAVGAPVRWARRHEMGRGA